MRHPSPSIALLAAALGGIVACRSDSVTRPAQTPDISASHAQGSGPTLVVDNDRVECPLADFTSIQAAVNAAAPGTTILVCAGTYSEWVVIQTNDLRVLAQAPPGDVVLDGQNIPAPVPCAAASLTAVQCAGFELRNAHRNVIQGFLIRRYWEAGIWLRMGSSGNTIRKNVTTASPHHDGIQVAGSSDNTIEHNVAIDNPDPSACGINLAGGSQRNVVRQNLLMNNEWGIQAAGATTLDNVIFENVAVQNRGNGIRNVASASGTVIDGNRVFRNGLTPGPNTGSFASGIRVAIGTGITVTRNQAFDNLFFDLRNDAGAGATFESNHCRTSFPPGLCAPAQGAAPTP